MAIFWKSSNTCPLYSFKLEIPKQFFLNLPSSLTPPDCCLLQAPKKCTPVQVTKNTCEVMMFSEQV